jgi:hypothetical protein
MKARTKKAINDLLEIKEENYDMLEEKLNQFLVAIENSPNNDLQKKTNIRDLANDVKSFMDSYRMLINGAIYSILETIDVREV